MVCHATYQLGCLMLKGALTQSVTQLKGQGIVSGVVETALSGEDSGVWENIIHRAHDQLYVALMVRQPTQEVYNQLVHLYSHCGFQSTKLPDHLNFDSMTPYSPYPFLPSAAKCKNAYSIAMFKKVELGRIYDGVDMIIVDPFALRPVQDSQLLVHSFDAKYLDFVKTNGLVLDRQRPLFEDWDEDKVYVANTAPCGIFFSDDYCCRANSRSSAVFVIRVLHEIKDDHVRNAIPANMAVFIGEAGVYKSTFEKEISAQQRNRGSTVAAVLRSLFSR
jgi:hypothetical protein